MVRAASLESLAPTPPLTRLMLFVVGSGWRVKTKCPSVNCMPFSLRASAAVLGWMNSTRPLWRPSTRKPRTTGPQYFWKTEQRVSSLSVGCSGATWTVRQRAPFSVEDGARVTCVLPLALGYGLLPWVNRAPLWAVVDFEAADELAEVAGLLHLCMPLPVPGALRGNCWIEVLAGRILSASLPSSSKTCPTMVFNALSTDLRSSNSTKPYAHAVIFVRLWTTSPHRFSKNPTISIPAGKQGT
mmetsp:Transcript_41204/g.73893  ORF Transcript_41204/g.73893 Transcript_41204/m.73893 type:complete len:242 (+) Transcript_41204:337-1062(+)